MTKPSQAQTIRINGQLHRVMRSMMGKEYYVPIPRENNMTKPTKEQIEAAARAIERCAQVADEMGASPGFIVAAKIRALKEKPILDHNLNYPSKDQDFVFPEE